MRPDHERERQLNDGEPWIFLGGILAALIGWAIVNFVTAAVWFWTWKWMSGK